MQAKEAKRQKREAEKRKREADKRQRQQEAEAQERRRQAEAASQAEAEARHDSVSILLLHPGCNSLLHFNMPACALRCDLASYSPTVACRHKVLTPQPASPRDTPQVRGAAQAEDEAWCASVSLLLYHLVDSAIALPACLHA